MGFSSNKQEDLDMAINLNKITLEKQGDSHRISLTKGGTKEIVINLNWSAAITPEKKGFLAGLFGGGSTEAVVDLDLGCCWQSRAGEVSVIDGVQFSHGKGGPRNQVTCQGCYTAAPWVWHTGDDRTGSSSDGENMLVNPRGISELKRLIIYCFIYEGAAKWADTNAIVTVKVPDNPDIVVEMGQQGDQRKFCAIAEIQCGADDSLTVKKLITFHNGHAECDCVYNWGLQWGPGSK
jgi:tellurite resistance protein TerA